MKMKMRREIEINKVYYLQLWQVISRSNSSLQYCLLVYSLYLSTIVTNKVEKEIYNS